MKVVRFYCDVCKLEAQEADLITHTFWLQKMDTTPVGKMYLEVCPACRIELEGVIEAWVQSHAPKGESDERRAEV